MNRIYRKSKLVASGLGLLWLGLAVRVAPAAAITVTPLNPGIRVGQTQQFTETGALAPESVSAGGSHTCVRVPLPDGRVVCAGQNFYGQRGDGTFDQGVVLDGAANPLAPASSVVAGDGHTCALRTDHTVWCWGVGDSGQRGDGGFDVAQPTPVSVMGIADARQIAARGYHTCALLGDGTVWCWGRNSEGQLGSWPAGTQCPTTPDLMCSPTSLQVQGITGADGVTAIAAGGYHTCALFPGGTVKCWGRNHQGQLGGGTPTFAPMPTPVQAVGITGASAITAGFSYTCALFQSDGTVQCWGENAFGQLGDGFPLPGRSSNPPTRVSGITGAVAISGGGAHTCVLLGNGTVWCWGQNFYGQLGNGITLPATPQCPPSCSSTPVQVSGITTAVAIGAGITHTCAVLAGGTVQCWGRNSDGELGNGTTTDSSTPVTMTGTGLTVTWTSSNSVVATVDDVNGLATGQSAGTTTITATDSSGASASTTLTVIDRTATDPVTLSVLLSTPGSSTGSVSSSPPGITCGTECSTTFQRNTVVTLTATPGPGSFFNGWDSGCDAPFNETCTMTMDVPKTVTAAFTFDPPLKVSLKGSGGGGVTSSDGLISCSKPDESEADLPERAPEPVSNQCQAMYAYGASVTLTATPAAESTFAGWSGACTGVSSTCALTMTTAQRVKAAFNAPRITLMVKFRGTGSGTVTSSDVLVDCSDPGSEADECVASYAPGATVTLTARAADGSTFAGWGGACTGTGSCTLTMGKLQQVTATFSSTSP